MSDSGRPVRVSFYTIGCKLNQYETELIAQKLLNLGLERVEWHAQADLYIINSCSVTSRAVADSRRRIFSARRSAPAAKIVITGCYAQIQSALHHEIPQVDLVVGNDEREQIVGKIAQLFPGIGAEKAAPTGTVLQSFFKHSRALIKIQDGCDQKCSYCVVPLGRGPERSRSSAEILREIRMVREHNYKEIILTGVHIGRYNNEYDLAGLLDCILQETEVERIRLSSLEVNEIDERLIALAAGNSRICPHFHIPLQSGSDRILREMNRPYQSDLYVSIVEALKSRIANVMIGADIIVGFPGESEQDFRESVNLVENSPLDYLHVFSYSDHPEAKSYYLSGKVPGKMIKARNKALTEVGNIKWQKFMNSQLPRILPVLLERRIDRKSGYLTGLSDNYIRVECPGPADYYNEIKQIRPLQISERRMIGEIIQ